jgi:hypothetical protein
VLEHHAGDRRLAVGRRKRAGRVPPLAPGRSADRGRRLDAPRSPRSGRATRIPTRHPGSEVLDVDTTPTPISRRYHA